MQPALRPLYCLPVRDHCALTLRLPCGRALDLVLFAGPGFARSFVVVQLTGCALRVVTAGIA